MIERPKSKSPLPENAKMVFKGTVFEVWQWEQELFDGSKKVFEKIKRPDSVEMVTITETGKIILLDEIQPGREPFISIPAGQVDEDEDIVASARRELLEETGFVPKTLELWYAEQPYGRMEWAIYTFIARGCKKMTETHLDAGEKISIREVDFDDFWQSTLDPTFRTKSLTLKLLASAQEEGGREKIKHFLLG